MHKLILSNSLPNFDPNILREFDSDVVHVILHYVYGQCLPRDISEETIQKCLQKLDNVPQFKPIVDKLNAFKRKSNFCQGRIVFIKIFYKSFSNHIHIADIHNLVTEIHCSANAIILEFQGMPVNASSKFSSSKNSEMMLQNPTRLSQAFRQSLRHLALCIVKGVHLARKFVQSRNQLSHEEQTVKLNLICYSISIYIIVK